MSDPDDYTPRLVPVLRLGQEMVIQPVPRKVRKTRLTDRRVRGPLIAVVLLSCLLLACLGWNAWIEFRPDGAEPSFDFDQQRKAMQQFDSLPANPSAPETVVGEDLRIDARGTEAAVRNAQTPFLSLGARAPRFQFTGDLDALQQARSCLAATMLYEAGNDPAGQYAVGQVVLNRVRHPAFPSTVCGVVLQGSERRSGCQFTYTCDGALARRYSDSLVAAAMSRADVLLGGYVEARVGLATHYHTDQVYPAWSPQLDKIARVGSHLFFRWKGYWGTVPAFAQRHGGPERSSRKLALFAPVGASDTDLDDPANLSAMRTGDDASENRITEAQMDGNGAAAESYKSPAERIPQARRLPSSGSARAGAGRTVLNSAAIGGNEVVRFFDESGTFFLSFQPGQSSRERQKIADLLCGGRETCRVYGWKVGSVIPKGPEITDRERADLVLEFVREAETGRVPQ